MKRIIDFTPINVFEEFKKREVIKFLSFFYKIFILSPNLRFGLFLCSNSKNKYVWEN